MSLVRRMLAVLGVGCARLWVEADQRTYPRGGLIRGTVRVEGGVVDQNAPLLHVGLAPPTMLGSPGGQQSARSGVSIFTELRVLAGAERTYSFELQVPENAALNGGFAEIWTLRASLSLRNCIVDAAAELPITITPHPEVMAVLAACRSLGFMDPVPIGSLLRSKGSNGGVETFHEAPLSLKDQIYGLEMRLGVSDSTVIGSIRFRRRAVGLAEWRDSLFKPDTEEFHLELARGSLINASGGPNAAGAVAALRSILRQAVILPENVDERTLLRSFASADAENLLHPVTAHGTAEDDELLRPATPDR